MRSINVIPSYMALSRHGSRKKGLFFYRVWPSHASCMSFPTEYNWVKHILINYDLDLGHKVDLERNVTVSRFQTFVQQSNIRRSSVAYFSFINNQSSISRRFSIIFYQRTRLRVFTCCVNSLQKLISISLCQAIHIFHWSTNAGHSQVSILFNWSRA